MEENIKSQSVTNVESFHNHPQSLKTTKMSQKKEKEFCQEKLMMI